MYSILAYFIVMVSFSYRIMKMLLIVFIYMKYIINLWSHIFQTIMFITAK